MLFFLGNALFVTIIFILESVSEYTPGTFDVTACVYVCVWGVGGGGGGGQGAWVGGGGACV